MKTKIFLADDHAMMREGLRMLISRQPDMQIVGEAQDGRETLRTAPNSSPDIIIMDVEMPHLNGIEATRQLISANRQTSVIALSAHADGRYITEMLKAGAKGYLLKHSASDELLTAIHTVMQGKTYISPEIAATVATEYKRKTAAPGTPFSKLSAREREILQMLAEGTTRKEIAASLFVSVKTIATHVEHIMTKLDLHSVAELTKYAIREGLTSLDQK